MRQEGLNRTTAPWSAVLSVVHLLKHRDHSLCLGCRACWFSRMMLRVFTLWTISERRFYIIFHLILPEFYLPVQKEATSQWPNQKALKQNAQCGRARLWDKGCFLVWLWWLPDHTWVQNLSGEKAEKAGLTVQLYLYCSSKSPWIPSKQTTDQLLLKVQIITKKKNDTLQSLILKIVVHIFF